MCEDNHTNDKLTLALMGSRNCNLSGDQRLRFSVRFARDHGRECRGDNEGNAEENVCRVHDVSRHVEANLKERVG